MTRRRDKTHLKHLGPGIIAGAADDDPAGIGTYSQVGAQYGTGLLWSLPFSLPFMIGFQQVCALLGRATGERLVTNLRRRHSTAIAAPFVLLLVVANVVNIGADLNAMGASVTLLAGGPPFAWIIAMAALVVGLEVFVRYKRYSVVLKILTLSLLAYVGVVLLVDVDWPTALIETVRIPIVPEPGYAKAFLAVLGTTISPYLFFWQNAQEVEELDGAKPFRRMKGSPKRQELRIRRDTIAGMVASNTVAYFIVLAAAVTLFASGQTDIHTAEEAARVLEPLAGRFASHLFAFGVVSLGLLGVPVLAGSAAFAVADLFGWRATLDAPVRRARAFYAVLAGSVIVGVLLNLSPIPAIDALVLSAVANGIAAAPLALLVMMLSRDRRILGDYRLPPWVSRWGWATAALLVVSAGLYLLTFALAL